MTQDLLGCMFIVLIKAVMKHLLVLG